MSQLPSIPDADQIVSKLIAAFKSYSASKTKYDIVLLQKKNAETALNEFYQTHSPIKSGTELNDFIPKYDQLSKNLVEAINDLKTFDPAFKKSEEDLINAIPYEGVKFEPETDHFVRKVKKTKEFRLEYEHKQEPGDLEETSTQLPKYIDPIMVTKDVKSILEDDLFTYEFVTNELKRKEYLGAMGPPNENIKGGLCFGMALTAFGAFDLLAYIIEGGNLDRGETGKNFKSLMSEENKKKYFGDAFPEIDHEIFYNVLRNGMVHKLFPKNMGLGADVSLPDLIMGDGTESLSLNTYYLLKQTINGYSNFIQEMENLESDALEIYRSRYGALRISDKSQFLQAFGKRTEKRDHDRSVSELGNIPKVKVTEALKKN